MHERTRSPISVSTTPSVDRCCENPNVLTSAFLVPYRFPAVFMRGDLQFQLPAIDKSSSACRNATRRGTPCQGSKAWTTRAPGGSTRGRPPPTRGVSRGGRVAPAPAQFPAQANVGLEKTHTFSPGRVSDRVCRMDYGRDSATRYSSPTRPSPMPQHRPNDHTQRPVNRHTDAPRAPQSRPNTSPNPPHPPLAPARREAVR